MSMQVREKEVVSKYCYFNDGGKHVCKEIMFAINELREQRAMIHRSLLLQEKKRHVMAASTQNSNSNFQMITVKLTQKAEILRELELEITATQAAYEKVVNAGGILLSALSKQGEVDAEVEMTTVLNVNLEERH